MPDTPVTWLDDFVANLKTTGIQDDPSITVLASGHILVVWTDFDGTGVGAPAGTDIVGRVFDSLGAPVTGDIRLNTATLSDQFNVEVTALPGGGFTIVYDRANVFKDLILDTYDYEPGVGVSYVGGADLYSAAGSDNPIHPVIAANSDTDALAAYTMNFANGTQQIFVRPYNPSTNTFGAADDVFFGTSGAGEDLVGPEVLALGDGRYALAVINRNAGTDTVNLLIREANGAVTIHTIDSGSEFTDVAIAALTTGHIVVAYIDTSDSGNIAYAVVNDDGSELPGGGPFFIVPNAQVDPAVVGLADGSFIIAWLDATTGQIRGAHRYLGDNGPFFVELDFLIDDTGGGGISGIKLAAFADGRFAVTWEAGDDIRTKIMDSRDLVNDPAVYTPDSQQIGTIGDDVFTADADATQVFGHDGNDTITENGDIKKYFGGKGDDTLLVGSFINNDLHDGGEGTDTIDWAGSFEDGVTFNLAAGTATRGADIEQMTNFENLNGTNDSDTIIGGIGVNILNGNGGDDTIRGEGDVDSVNGGAGNDTIIVSGSDFSDNVDGGTETDLYQFDYTDLQVAIDLQAQTLEVTLPGFGLWGVPVTVANVENVTGGELNDSILGDGLANVLKGRGGADTLEGRGGNDTLDGGSGADTLRGGADDDTYFVDNSGDVIVEAEDQGTADRVRTSVSYVPKADVHVEQLATTSSTRTSPINLTGNALAQEIIGNYGNNILRDGPSGGAADVLRGLNGNDTYQVYNSATTIVESTSAAAGTADRIMAGVDYKLAAGVGIEIMTTNGSTGTSGIDLTGNALKQEITGNAGANVLSSGAVGAADTMTGLGGNDTYRVYNSGDVIVESTSASGGTADRVAAAVDYALNTGVGIEIMTTNGSTGTSGIDLTGNALKQSITGNAGSNILDGKGGSDTLTGLGGKDFFLFSSALGASNVDTITDFNPVDDTIRLENAIFTELTTTGVLSASLFKDNFLAARDADDRIIYNSNTGSLFYDADGLGGGAAVKFALLAPGLALTAADFVVV
jgi:Ca2+-binding RTX toxin-like protein